MNFKFQLLILVTILLSCSKDKKTTQYIQAVSYGDFETFIKETGYITDAERYNWSIVQQDVFNYKVVKGADWKSPDGISTVENPNLPVTQVSYNDALTYCKWADVRLPTYEEYWELIENDKRIVITDNSGPISNVKDVNLLGNVWELTQTVNGNSVRLAGGSIFCSKDTCHGTNKERELYVDKETGNIHIGFAVITKP